MLRPPGAVAGIPAALRLPSILSMIADDRLLARLVIPRMPRSVGATWFRLPPPGAMVADHRPLSRRGGGDCGGGHDQRDAAEESDRVTDYYHVFLPACCWVSLAKCLLQGRRSLDPASATPVHCGIPISPRDVPSCPAAGVRLPSAFAPPCPSAHSNLAGEEKGRVASTTNMTSCVRSVVPALNTSIGVSAPCPFMDCPTSA